MENENGPLNIPPELQAKIQMWKQRGEQERSAPKEGDNSGSDVAIKELMSNFQMVSQALSMAAVALNHNESRTGKTASDMESAFSAIKDATAALKELKTSEKSDITEPLMQVAERIEKAFESAIGQKPDTPKVSVASPKVNVTAPPVDLSGVEKIMRNEVPKAFEKAIKSIPKTEIPENDYSELSKQLAKTNEWLESIDTASRMKVQIPSTLKVTNTDGSAVGMTIARTSRVQQPTTITSSTTETTVLTAVAATYLDVYGVIAANTSASATEVVFRDATAGTARFSIMVPAGETRGFMLPASSAHNQTTLNNNWTAQCGTSVASVKVTVFAIKST
jgi:hypothetical protein